MNAYMCAAQNAALRITTLQGGSRGYILLNELDAHRGRRETHQQYCGTARPRKRLTLVLRLFLSLSEGLRDITWRWPWKPGFKGQKTKPKPWRVKIPTELKDGCRRVLRARTNMEQSYLLSLCNLAAHFLPASGPEFSSNLSPSTSSASHCPYNLYSSPNICGTFGRNGCNFQHLGLDGKGENQHLQKGFFFYQADL